VHRNGNKRRAPRAQGIAFNEVGTRTSCRIKTGKQGRIPKGQGARGRLDDHAADGEISSLGSTTDSKFGPPEKKKEKKEPPPANGEAYNFDVQLV